MLVVRQANVSDAAAIAKVHVDTWRDAYRGIMPDHVLDGLSYRKAAKAITSRLREPLGGDVCYVAEGNDGNAVGFVWAGREREEQSAYDGEIYAIYVLPGQQRRGVGKALTAAAARHLKGMGLGSLRLWVLEDNRAGRAFYERLGGKQLESKSVEIRGVSLVEAGYGWDNINVLAGMTTHD